MYTYLCPKKNKKKECAQGDFGHHVGERVACKYKGNLVQGDVIAVSLGDGEETQDEWTVQFEDGHVITCGKARLRQLLKRGDSEQIGKQIDHILVSTRWKSSVTHCKTRWGPSIHRSLTGRRSDYALLECRWKWRMRQMKTESSPDFSVLRMHQDNLKNLSDLLDDI